MTRQNATGHIVIRRRAKDGKDGQPGSRGAKPRFSVFASNRLYLSGTGEEVFYDIVFSSTAQQFFRCIKSITVTPAPPPVSGSSTMYWQYEPALDNFFVDVLCANQAFINALVVKHLDAADGSFSGTLNVNNEFIVDAEGNMQANSLKMPFRTLDECATYNEYSRSYILGKVSNVYCHGVFMYNYETYMRLPSFDFPNGQVYNLWMPPRLSRSDPTYRISTADGAARIYDMDHVGSSGFPIAFREFCCGGGYVQIIAFSPDGSADKMRWMIANKRLYEFEISQS